MILVVLFVNGKKHSTVEAEDAENAVYAAQTIWDECKEHWIGKPKLEIGFYGHDGKLIRMCNARPMSPVAA